MNYPTELTPALREVLGKPNFWCAPLANWLRQTGQEIESRAEAEQAAVLHWLIPIALEHGDNWREVSNARIKAMLESTIK